MLHFVRIWIYFVLECLLVLQEWFLSRTLVLQEYILRYQRSSIFTLVAIGVIIGFLIWFFVVRRRKASVYLQNCQNFVRSRMSSRPRFRKRDKVMFYGRKMLRTMRTISGGQGKKRKLMIKIAHKLLRVQRDSDLPTKLKVTEPPDEYLQEDERLSTDEQKVPIDAFYMLQSIRVFGHFERPIFLKLCKHTEILNIPAGCYLFRIGEPDENVYIVQSGRVDVFVSSPDGQLISLKLVNAGESITSLLSFADVLTGHPQPFKTVSARAVDDCVIVRLPVSAFQLVFQEHPDTFIRIMQVIMVRLQRVTFTALHQYLGLTTELVNPTTHLPHAGGTTGPSRKFTAPPQMGSPFHYDYNGTHASLVPTAPMSGGLEGSATNASHVHRHRRARSSGIDLINVRQTAPDITSNTEQHVQMSQRPQRQSDLGPSSAFARKRSDALASMDEAALLECGIEAFAKELHLPEDSPALRTNNTVQIRNVPTNTYLMQHDSHKDVALVYVLSGALSVYQRVTDQHEEEIHLYTVHPGQVFGALAVLTGDESFFTVRTKHQTTIAFVSKSAIYAILREEPRVVLHLADMVVRRLSPFVRQVDFALDWLFIESGRAVYRQDDESDSTFIVLSGRLRSVITHENGKKEIVAEYGKGDLVGIVEMVTQTPRSTTVMAIRDSELAKLPEGLFNAIKLRFPIVVTRLIKLLGHRILGSWKKLDYGGLGVSSSSCAANMDSNLIQSNFSTVAIVPVTDDVPLSAFTYELYHSLSHIGSALRLNSDVIRRTLGPSIMEPNNEYRLTSWLAQQEDQYQMTLYQCDPCFTLWTQRCVRQADCILIVGLGYKAPTLCKIEKEIEKLTIRTQKELVLLYREGEGESSSRPRNTAAWLNMRSWISSHHHILCKSRVFAHKSQHHIDEFYTKIMSSDSDIYCDFSRVARWLTGTSVGLVLGGGGARGAAHIGMIKAIQEAGIPIDMVGGVSIGAFMGALWCSDRNVTTMTQKARDWSVKMTHWWRQMFDLTYPMTSMFTGRDFNVNIHGTLGDAQIEDLWIPYFTITTDISASQMRVHTHGPLWQYVRASMSLSGYMPPLCDPLDGHLLLDGGYVNNLPASVMRSRGAKYILAIDVGCQDDTDLTNYGDSLSGWWLLWKRYNPFTTSVKVPNLPDIQSRLAYVSCVRQLEEVKNSDYCEYIRPPIDKYKTLQFGSFDEIREVGYNHGTTYFAGLKKAGQMPLFKKSRTSVTSTCSASSPNYSLSSWTSPLTNAHLSRNYTFTDLAQMVCKVQCRKLIDECSCSDENSSSDDEEVISGYTSEPSDNFFRGGQSDVSLPRGGSACFSETELDESRHL